MARNVITSQAAARKPGRFVIRPRGAPERRDVIQLSMDTRELYASPNGDRWFLVREPSGAVFVRHEANASSGGHIDHIDLRTFLARGGSGPEHQELLRLMSTLLDGEPHAPAPKP